MIEPVSGTGARSVPPADLWAKSLSWWLLALIFVVAFFAYAHTIPYEFVADDEWQIVRNPWIRSWSELDRLFSTHVWAFSSSEGVPSYYRPLHMLAYALVYGVAGMRPEGFHVLNILLHGACAVLVAVFSIRLTRDKAVSVAGGLLFALHPIHAESVAWIAGLMDPLCAMFYLGALCAHVKGCAQADTRSAGLLTATLFLAALLSKEMAFSFPLVVVWLDWCVSDRLRWKRYITILGAFALYSGLRVAVLSSFLVEHLPLELSWGERVLSTVVIMGRYVTRAFLPHDISSFHVFEATSSPLDPEFIWSAAALVLLAAGAWWLRADRRILFLLGSLLLMLAPVLDVTGLGWNVFAERYLYLPSVASCLLMPLLAQRIWHALPLRGHVSGWPVAGIGLALALLAFTGMLWNTTFLWRDGYTLYTETLRRSPEAGLIARQLAAYQMARGEYDDAEKWGLRAKVINDKLFARYKVGDGGDDLVLGALSLTRGDPTRAMESFRKAHEQDPRNAKALQLMGSVHASLGEYDEARRYYEQALALNSRNEAIYSNLAFVDVASGNYDSAIERARKAIEIYPRYAEAYLNLARAYARKGMDGEARAAYLRVQELNPQLCGAVEQELGQLAPSATEWSEGGGRGH